jgi:drug/metabolite transporter (DMT)-like permease
MPAVSSHYAAATPGRQHPGVGITLGLAASLAFATSGTFARPLLNAGWTPAAAVFWRVCAASVLLLPVGLWSVRGRLRLVLTEWRLVATFGVLAVAMAQGMYFAAVSRMSVSVALLIEYMAPVALVLLAWTRQRQAPSRLVLAGTAASVAGLFFVLDLTGARLDGLGVLFGFGAMTGAAAYFLLGARQTNLPAVALPAFGLPVGAAALGFLIATGLLPYSAPLVAVELLGAHVPWWVPLSVVVIFATAAAYTLGVAGISLMGERLSSFVSLSEVLFAALVAAVVIGEIPTPVQILGGALIVLGVVLIKMSNPDASAGVPTLAEQIEAAHPHVADTSTHAPHSHRAR